MIRDKNKNKLNSTEHPEYSFKFGYPRCSDAVEINQRTRSFNPRRIFPEFKESIAYLDIETTGLDFWSNQITTIAVYDGRSIFTYIQGQNLDEFKEDIQKYKVLVTYNGKCFDVPFLQSYFGITLNQVHIDLRYVLKSLGYTGGLKGCEKKAGIDRGNLEGVDGYFAVFLWNDYQRNKNHKALETLLAYNIQDVVNLETLMVLSYNLKLKETPFNESHQLVLPSTPEIPFKADLETIDRIRRDVMEASIVNMHFKGHFNPSYFHSSFRH